MLDDSKKEDFITQLDMVKADGLFLEHIPLDTQHKTVVL
jgi:hypothetical protein